MRRISSGLFPCRRVEMSRVSLRDLPGASRLLETVSKRSLVRASVHVDLPGWTKYSVDKLKERCEQLHLQPRGTRGESGGQTGHTYDISNKHRLRYSEVELVQKMIDGVNKLWEEDLALQKKLG